MTDIVLNIADFRVDFAEFSNSTTYPDNRIQRRFDMGTDYVSPVDYGSLNGNARRDALYLMTAHLLKIQDAIASGLPLAFVTSASQGSVSVGLMPPVVKNHFQYWLSTTPYGSQLWALLKVKSVGGFMVGGSDTMRGFRKNNGRF